MRREARAVGPVQQSAQCARIIYRHEYTESLKIQERAGIDVVADGELYRWDINHPETNGMIDYFLRPMDGIVPDLTIDQLHHRRRRCGSSGDVGRRGRETWPTSTGINR